jgi:L-glyceraldehyde 3-phosphate reductase
VRQGKALYVGISSYSDVRAKEAVAILRSLGTPLLIHQPSYSMFNRWIENRLLDVLGEEGVGCIGFSPLAQGLLTERYLHEIPAGSRLAEGSSLFPDMVSEENLSRVRALADIAAQRGQKVSQLALVWALRDPRVTSLVIGASSVAQLEENVAALNNMGFTAEELKEIDVYAVEGGIDLWRGPATS